MIKGKKASSKKVAPSSNKSATKTTSKAPEKAPEKNGKKGPDKNEQVEDLKKLEEALSEAFDTGIQPILDAFDEWDEKYPGKLSHGQAVVLAEKIVKSIKDGVKKALDILE